MILQLDPPLPLETPKGSGFAHFLIDYGAEYNLMFVVFLDDSGECWTYQTKDVRATKNITLGRVPQPRSDVRGLRAGPGLTPA